MSGNRFLERLDSGPPLVMDGATGSELQRRGVYVSHGVSEDRVLGAWSATAMRDAPDVVREVHEDYLKVGADILITNSFWTNSVKLGLVGLEDQAEAYTRMAGEIAVEARDRLKPDAFVAGGMAPPHGGRPEVPVDREDLAREFAMQARELAAAGVDFILPEYVGWIEDCVTAVDTVSNVGLPVVLGVRHVTETGTMQHGESFEDLVAALDGREVAAILLMCSSAEAIDVCLPRLAAAFDGPVGAYPNTGYGESDESVEDGGHFHSIDTTSHGPDRLAGHARRWFDDGARIVGGCCATTPDHIAAVRELV
ncbi:MAG: homocysteine S-methyltransferase family protein [Alphaproteobacteria bacterium]|nr:homocysteine S-methyltransferase family protein [Alphaproteobacteria bacterium]